MRRLKPLILVGCLLLLPSCSERPTGSQSLPKLKSTTLGFYEHHFRLKAQTWETLNGLSLIAREQRMVKAGGPSYTSIQNKGLREAKEVLGDLGIPFPTGTSASYDRGASLLRVTHTSEAVDEIRQLLRPLASELPQVEAELNMVEMTEETFRSLPRQQIGAKEMLSPSTPDRLLALVREGNAVMVDVICDRTTSGEGSKQSHTTQYTYVEDYEITKGLAHLKNATTEIGTVLDWKPSVGSSGTYINITMSPEMVWLLQPVKKRELRLPGVEKPVFIEEPEFHKFTCTTSLILHDGDTVLLGVFRRASPSEEPKKDSPWVYVFFTARVVDPLEP